MTYSKDSPASGSSARAVERKTRKLKVWQYQGESTLAQAPGWVREYRLLVNGSAERIRALSPGKSLGTSSYLLVPTREVCKHAGKGDWLIRLQDGELRVCSSEEFRALYKVQDPAADPSLKLPIFSQRNEDISPIDHAHNRNLTFEGIDLAKVPRELRHGIVDRRVLLAEVARLRALVADSEEELNDTHKEVATLKEQVAKLQRALALWLPKESFENPHLEFRRRSDAALVEACTCAPGLAGALEQVGMEPTRRGAPHEGEPAHTAPQRSLSSSAGPANESSSVKEVPAPGEEIQPESEEDRLSSLLLQAAQTIRALHAEQKLKEARINALEAICAASYQMAGAYQVPTRFLDALALHDKYLELSAEEIFERLLPVEIPSHLLKQYQD